MMTQFQRSKGRQVEMVSKEASIANFICTFLSVSLQGIKLYKVIITVFLGFVMYIDVICLTIILGWCKHNCSFGPWILNHYN